MQVNIKATSVFQRNWEANTRIIVNQGGTRSSKTYSIAQYFILKLLQETGKVLTITRKTMPSLKQSVMRDFYQILSDSGIYDEASQNKSDHTYKLNGNLVEFVSLDQPQKKRGTKRDYLWMNEANEFTEEDFLQLILRTSEKIILDYNPSDEFHWIYDKILPRNDCTFIQSTYKDNTFLPKETIEEIERLKDTDENYWKIYGLGERGHLEGLIFTNWSEANFPDEGGHIYGLDFGFNNPTALTKVLIKEKNCYVDQVIYQSHLTNQQLIDMMKSIGVESYARIYCDAAEPQRIEELRQAGFHVMSADKSVMDGIDRLKRMKIIVSPRSNDLKKELRSYVWQKDKLGRVVDKEPVKFNDHAIDSMRYAVHTSQTGASGRYAII